MGVLRNALRIYSYIFEAVLCLMAIAVSGITLLSGNEELALGWLPWTGASLPVWLMVLGLAGLFALGLAVFGKWRIPFFLFALFVCGLLVRGFLFSPYTFRDAAEVKRAGWLIAGAVLALAGAWPARPASQQRKNR
ncbi:MAG: hypothetical protein M3Z36_04075 [Acidobacteriota bacterium]|nr:hypothetical protein [Acidobacteriota bacterium]